MPKLFLFLSAVCLLLIGISCSSGQKTTAAGCIDQSKIDPDKACIELYDPVCGCDGKTYSNSCFAGIAGVTSFKPGECP